MSGNTMHLPDDLIEQVKPFAERDGKTVATWIRDLAREATYIAAVNYTGPGPTVKCGYPPCTNRLSQSPHGGPQWCSHQHREWSE